MLVTNTNLLHACLCFNFLDIVFKGLEKLNSNILEVFDGESQVIFDHGIHAFYPKVVNIPKIYYIICPSATKGFLYII